MSRQLYHLAMLPLILPGCADWSATPEHTLSHRGASVDAMITGQLYAPDQAAHPATTSLATGLEGRKAEAVLQHTYQEDTGSPERVRAPGQLNIRGGSSSSQGSSAQSGTAP